MKYLYLFFLLILGACYGNNFTCDGQKFKGVNLVASPQPMGPEVITALQQLGVEWVSLMPYAFTQMGDTSLHYNLDRQWWGERDDGLIESIRLAQEQGLEVMLKPHIWLQGGGFTGDLTFEKESQWQAWERSYTAYLLHHARISDSMQVPLLCIGTELTLHNRQRPHYWRQLIDTLRTVYSGKLTYAANWDAVEDFPHWKALDYIGVDAYFPLTQSQSSAIKEIAEGWRPHLQLLRRQSARHQKPVLFTEWGYRSITATTQEPWRSDTEGAADEEAQARAYEAFFVAVWPEPWFAGVFVWKWYPNIPQPQHQLDTDFTPQGKAAQEVLKKEYSKR